MIKIQTNIIVRAVFVVLLIVFAVWLSLSIADSKSVKTAVENFGYTGVLLIAILSGFNIGLPIPAVTFMPIFIAAGLAFWPLLVVITIGMTLGDTMGFFIGDAGRKLTTARAEALRDGKVFRYIESFREKHKTWPYILLGFYVALAPAPNEVVVIPMAFAGYPLRYMFPVILIGNLVFNIILAFGILGIIGLL